MESAACDLQLADDEILDSGFGSHRECVEIALARNCFKTHPSGPVSRDTGQLRFVTHWSKATFFSGSCSLDKRCGLILFLKLSKPVSQKSVRSI